MKETKILHLVSSEDVVAGVEEFDDHYLLSDPMQLLLGPNNQLGMIPYPTFSAAHETIMINKRHVMVLYKGSEQITNEYSAKFGGIIKPASGIVVPGQ